MSGEYELPEGLKPTGTGTILGLKMLRSIARVDVTATEVANFRMTGVKAYRANNYLQVIPDETGVSKGNVFQVYPKVVTGMWTVRYFLFLQRIGIIFPPGLLFRNLVA